MDVRNARAQFCRIRASDKWSFAGQLIAAQQQHTRPPGPPACASTCSCLLMATPRPPPHNPQTDDELVALALSGVQDLLRHCDAEKNGSGQAWVSRHVEPKLKLTVFESSNGDGPRCFKAVVELPFSVQAVVTTLLDTDRRMQWDRNILRLAGHTIRTVSPKNCAPSDVVRFLIFHSCTKAVGPISGRDFVDCVYLGALFNLPTDVQRSAPKSVAAGAWVHGGRGLARGHEAFPECPSLVRGVNSSSGWLIEPVVSDAAPDACRIHYVVQSDLKGWLPRQLIAMSMTGVFVSFFGDLAGALAAA